MHSPGGLVVDFPTWARVNEVLQGYADALDRGDIDLLLSHFDTQAQWHYSPEVTKRGHDGIRAFFEERLSVFAHTSHNVCPPVVRTVAGPEPLSSVAYFVAEHQLVDGSRYRAWGRYVDTLRLDGERALICQRRVIAHVVEGTNRPYNALPRKPAPAKQG